MHHDTYTGVRHYLSISIRIHVGCTYRGVRLDEIHLVGITLKASTYCKCRRGLSQHTVNKYAVLYYTK